MQKEPTKSEKAWDALIAVMNSKPWFDKFFHTEAHKALDFLAKYISENITKEHQIQPTETQEQIVEPVVEPVIFHEEIQTSVEEAVQK